MNLRISKERREQRLAIQPALSSYEIDTLFDHRELFERVTELEGELAKIREAVSCHEEAPLLEWIEAIMEERTAHKYKAESFNRLVQTMIKVNRRRDKARKRITDLETTLRELVGGARKVRNVRAGHEEWEHLDGPLAKAEALLGIV